MAYNPKSSKAGPKIVEVVECALPIVAEPTITLGSEDLKNPIRVLYNNWP